MRTNIRQRLILALLAFGLPGYAVLSTSASRAQDAGPPPPAAPAGTPVAVGQTSSGFSGTTQPNVQEVLPAPARVAPQGGGQGESAPSTSSSGLRPAPASALRSAAFGLAPGAL